jgi:DnaK suppressor protein
MLNEPTVRYNDEDLHEFKVLIEQRIAEANQELDFLGQQINELNENGFNQQGGDKNDDATIHSDLEFLQRMATRQLRLIQDLRNALLRIQNKTYGICTVTGQLIDKNRLRLVPHATKTVDGKNIANAGKPAIPSESFSGEPFTEPEDADRPAKPIGDKVRMSTGKRPSQKEDWEVDSDTIENAGYNMPKYEDDEE